MSYLTDSYIVFTLKMESVFKNTIFGLKMMVKSGLENFIFKSLHVIYYWICDFGHFYEVRESSLPHGGNSKMFFLDHFSPSFLNQTCIFGYRFHFEGKNNVWISQVRRVKYPGTFWITFRAGGSWWAWWAFAYPISWTKPRIGQPFFHFQHM